MILIKYLTHFFFLESVSSLYYIRKIMSITYESCTIKNLNMKVVFCLFVSFFFVDKVKVRGEL